MKRRIMTITAVAAMTILAASCKKNKETDLSLSISGLQDLGSEYVYEGWIIVDDAPVSTGTFTVNSDGAMSATTFPVNQKNLEDATKFVVSIEPSNDTDPAPSAVKILGGDFSGTNASLAISHGAALGTDFADAMGTYLLATPSSADMTDENSGVWFIDPTSGSSQPGLILPTLPAGWAYEGWAVIDDKPVSTGTFTSATGADNGDFHNGTGGTPPFPGEDFLTSAPDGLTFPTDLAGKTVVISVEPMPDNSAAPFVLKPLVGSVPATATDHTPYTMGNNATATNPTGTVTR